jgi:hypothetical protein
MRKNNGKLKQPLGLKNREFVIEEKDEGASNFDY